MRFKLELVTGVSGMGPKVRKIIDTNNGDFIGYLGEIEGKEVVHFMRPIPIRRLAYLTNELTTYYGIKLNMDAGGG